MTTQKIRFLVFQLIFTLFLLNVLPSLATNDITGPVISDFVIEENGQTLTVGDTLHISAKITDESAVESAYVYLSAINDSSISFYVHLQYDAQQDRWFRDYAISENVRNAEYTVSYMVAKDIYANFKVYYPQGQNFTITGGSSDITGPVISDFVIEENGQSLTVGDTLHISAKITDESAVESAYVYLSAINDSSISFYVNLQYDAQQDRWFRDYAISENVRNAEYTVSYMVAKDIYANFKVYYPQGQNFTITGGSSDIAGPEVMNFVIEENGQTLTVGDTLHISAKITDESAVESAYVYLSAINDSSISFYVHLQYDAQQDRWFRDYAISENVRNAEYTVSYMVAKDIYANFKVYYPQGQSFTIIGTNSDNPIPEEQDDEGPVVEQAAPEDAEGAYILNANGEKEYLMFQTYEICMQYLGNDELCRSSKHCYNK